MPPVRYDGFTKKTADGKFYVRLSDYDSGDTVHTTAAFATELEAWRAAHEWDQKNPPKS